MRDVPKMVKMTHEIVKSTTQPVTVKTRLGWDENTQYIVEVAERLQDVGIQAITIHGRTRVQMYKGSADWTLIGEIKDNPRHGNSRFWEWGCGFSAKGTQDASRIRS